MLIDFTITIFNAGDVLGRSDLEQLGVGNGMQSKFSKKKQQGLMQ